MSLAGTASDDASGLISPVDTTFALVTSVPTGTETASPTTDSRTICDQAGNWTTVGPIAGIKVDKKPPSISVTGPTAATYQIKQAVTAIYACTDGGSGVATCAGPVPSGSLIDTASVGAKTFRVNGTDLVGNAASQDVSYAVTYNMCLLYDPARFVQNGRQCPSNFRCVTRAGLISRRRASSSQPSL